jgi:hypothetical protein
VQRSERPERPEKKNKLVRKPWTLEAEAAQKLREAALAKDLLITARKATAEQLKPLNQECKKLRRQLAASGAEAIKIPGVPYDRAMLLVPKAERTSLGEANDLTAKVVERNSYKALKPEATERVVERVVDLKKVDKTSDWSDIILRALEDVCSTQTSVILFTSKANPQADDSADLRALAVQYSVATSGTNQVREQTKQETERYEAKCKETSQTLKDYFVKLGLDADSSRIPVDLDCSKTYSVSYTTKPTGAGRGRPTTSVPAKMLPDVAQASAALFVKGDMTPTRLKQIIQSVIESCIEKQREDRLKASATAEPEIHISLTRGKK